MQLIRAKRSHLTQAGQALPVRFSFVRKMDEETFVQQTPGARCKEYLPEVLRWFHIKDYKSVVYGMRLPEEFVNDNYMLLQFPDKTSQDNFFSNLHLFAHFGWPCEVVYKKGREVIVQIDPNWKQTSWLISLWALLVKAFSYKNKQDPDTLLQYLPATEESSTFSVEHRNPGLLKKLLNNIRNIEIDKYDYTTTSDNYSVHSALGVFNTFGYGYHIKQVYKQRLLAL